MLAVDEVLGHAHRHAADGVDHVAEAVEVDDDEVVDEDVGVGLELRHRADRAALGVGGVPHHVGRGRGLAVVALGPVHDRVARDGDGVRPAAVRGDVHEDGGVGAAATDSPSMALPSPSRVSSPITRMLSGSPLPR